VADSESILYRICKVDRDEECNEKKLRLSAIWRMAEYLCGQGRNSHEAISAPAQKYLCENSCAT
jgi:hypothetical protein